MAPASAELDRRASSCAYHAGDNSGKTYDENGKVCPTLTSQDKIDLVAAMSFCAIVLIGLAVIYVRKYLRAKRGDEAMKRGASKRPMSSFTTPLIGQGGAFGISRMATSVLRRDPPPCHRGSMPDMSSPTFEECPSDESSSSGCHSPSSPYSDSSEQFAFPILSADGHLLPPAPASRRSWIDASRAGDGLQRPLPSPPLVPASPILSPRPLTSKRFQYQPARSRSPSPEHGKRPVFGLYPDDSTAYDGPFEILREDFDSELAGTTKSPILPYAQRTARRDQPCTANV